MAIVHLVVVVVIACLWASLMPPAAADPCLIISEINADNPRLDTTEFVELYHTSGRRASLEGYTLVFYNGNGNTAYKVLDLKGHSTDDRGFFLVGSVDLLPPPAIPLPPNTVQNGPDAVALYHSSSARYAERMNATAVGLVDAVVYAARRAGAGGGAGAETLAETLTPGRLAFVEDEGAHEGDESLERCLLSGQSWGFRVALPTPGQRNDCSPPPGGAGEPLVSEVKLGGGQADGWVELRLPEEEEGAEGQQLGSLALVVLDGKTDRVSVSLDVDTSRRGLVSIPIDRSYMRGDASGAVALYRGSAASFAAGSALSQTQPLDAFVFAGPADKPSANLTETLVPGREAYQLSSSLREGGFYLSRCGVATWTRDPGVFWEAHQTPGQPNQCPWPQICPHALVTPASTDAPPHLPPWERGDFLINEVNTDTPGAAEDGEFIELWHPSGQRVSLQGIWVLLFSGHNSRPYREISLTGHFTTANGYFLLGSDRMAPAPSLRLPPNTIQNGPDAVALYRSPFGPPSSLQPGRIPTRGLLDALVYRLRGSDKEARELSDALTPGQLPLLEDPEVLLGDEALSRCGGLHPADLSAFSVAPPTPLRENICPAPPPPPAGVVINEVCGGRWGNSSSSRGRRQQPFVELRGPPGTALRGLVLTALDQEKGGATVFAVPLAGATDQDGLYVVGNVTGADQVFPEGTALPARGAVVLCHDLFSVCRAGTAFTSSSLRDTLVFSNSQQLLSQLSATRGQHVVPAVRSVEDGPVSLSRCSCCEVRSPSSWTSSSPTPRATNHCPSPAFSSHIDLCLEAQSSNLQEHSGNCSGLIQDNTVMKVAEYLEQSCHCGISALYLQGANFSCVAGWLRVRGDVHALSDHQRALILQTSHTHLPSAQGDDICSSPTADRHVGAESALGLQIGLVAGMLLLLGAGAAIVTYMYKKRHPQDYYTMELNEHTDGLAEL